MFQKIARHAEVSLAGTYDLDDWADRMNGGYYPNEIEYTKDGKFYKVMKRNWDHGASA
jgi:hypothetical protein